MVVGRLSTSGGNLCVHICESQLQRRKANTAFSRSSGLGESEDVRGYEILPQAPERCRTMEDVGRWTRRCLRTSLSLNSIVDAMMVEVARCLTVSVCRTPCPEQQRTLQQNNLAPPTPSSVVFPDQLRSFRDIYWHLYWQIYWYIYCFEQYPSFWTNWTSSMNCSSFKSLKQKLDLTTLVFKAKQKDA